MVDFLFVIIELFSLSLTFETLQAKLAYFEVGWVTLSANFRWKGHCLPTTIGVTKLECGITISTIHCLVLSQSMLVTDRQTDRITTANTALAKLLAW